MASIRENVRDKKIVSFWLRTCVGRDEHSKQVFRTLTWHPPPNLTNAKARKLAQAYATQWEQEQRDQFLLEQAELIQKREIEAHRIYTFDSFVKDVWLPLRVRDGAHRPSTIAMYGYMLKVIMPHFQGLLMTDITGIMITTYLRWLRNDYRTNRGLPLADKTIKHHYNLLGMIFNYAEKQDVISKNPMKKVDPPLVRRKEVDALSEDDAQRFFKALESCPFEFRCILHLLATTGLRRGECVGLQWQDIDFEKATLSVKRSATYTKEFGISVTEPKTPKSKRTIPLMPSTLRLLAQLKTERSKRYPYTVLALSFVFCRDGKPFEARDPNAITRHMKRFIRAAGLPDVSPHDLRHTCATLLLSSGADIKSVQEILGHTDARTTLNFYVKADLSQMRVATDKYAKAFGL